jgi:uncharacterized membrane protein YbaN (DUF454 family)
MRRVGLILLAIGLAGFLLASTQKARHDGAARDAWETARWILAGIGVMGVVFTVLPGKKQ